MMQNISNQKIFKKPLKISNFIEKEAESDAKNSKKVQPLFVKKEVKIKRKKIPKKHQVSPSKYPQITQDLNPRSIKEKVLKWEL